MTGALKTKVEENREKIEFSRFLATIKIDVPVELDETKLIMEEPDKDKLIELFSELEFRGYLAKLRGTEPAAKVSTPKAPSLQGSLFDEPETEPVAVSSPIMSSEPVASALITDFATAATTEHIYKVVQTEREIAELCDVLSQVHTFCFDTETTSVDVLGAELS